MRASWAWGGVLLLAACAGVGGGPPAGAAAARRDDAAPVGHESAVLARHARAFGDAPAHVAFDHDGCGSLIVRRAGDTSPVRLLIAVGVDEPGYVVSQIRDDGLLRVRTLGGRNLGEAFHLAREGRPVFVATRTADVPGVLLVNSLHLRAPRPEVFDESALWLDVGADSPDDVAALGIGMLDPVVLSESARLAGERTAGTAAGAHAAVQVLAATAAAAAAAGQLPEGVAVAFVAQSQVSVSLPLPRLARIGPLGRGGEGVVRHLQPAETLVLRVADDVPDAVRGPDPVTGDGTAWKVLELRVRQAGTPVETVDDTDARALAARLWPLLGGTGEAPPITLGPNAQPGGGAGESADDPFTLLRALVLPRGVSGHEGPVRDEIRRQLAAINPAWSPQEDSAGNLVLTLGDGARTYAFAAHMDEIGLQVKAVREDGLLETERLGGLLEHLYRETVMELVTRDGRVLPCIALPKPKDTPKSEDPVILLDVGARSAAEVAALGVSVGDAATVPKELNALGAHRAAGRSNDDRVGCAALLLALRDLGPEADARLRAAGRRVVFAWTTKEETGLEGADVLARTLRPVPDVVFAIDTFVTSDSPLEDPRYAFAELGGGPVLRALDNSSQTPAWALDRVRAVAEPAGIPLQIGVMGGGNDGSRFVPEGSVDCPLAWPQRCSHSRVETLDLRDLQALGHLLAAVALDF
jgi:putative aminopeptidase FrvX